MATGLYGEPPKPTDAGLIFSETGSSVLSPAGGTEPWLGVSVQKPSEKLYALLEEIPPGVGFVVHGVAEDGPAAKAGLRQYDFLWKFGDQVLVNEAQFLVLLHLHKVGESVELTFQRDLKNHEVEAVLAERPATGIEPQGTEVAVMNEPPVPGLAKQMIDTLRQVASIKGEDDVTVRLERQGEGFHWQQIDSEEAIIQEGDLKGVHDIRFPAGTNMELAKKLRALIRACEDAEKWAERGGRPSRVRRLPVNQRKKLPNPR